MLNYLLVSLLVVFMAFQEPEKYVVINVVGTVTNKDSKLVLKKGDKILATNKLSFKTIKDKVDVLAPSKGRFTISPSAKYAKDNEFVALVKEMIAPAKSYSMTAVRGDNDVLCKSCVFNFTNPSKNNIEDLRFFFSRGGNMTKGKANDFYIIGKSSYTISDKAFIVNEQNFFCWRFLSGTDTVIQKISSKNNTITLSDALLTRNNAVLAMPADSLVELHYVQTAKNTNMTDKLKDFKRSHLICYMKPIMTSEKQVREDLALIVQNAAPNVAPKELYEKTIIPYVIEVYAQSNKGFANDADIKALLPEAFVSKLK